MDAIASVGFGIHLDAYGEESNEFIFHTKGIFDKLIGFGVMLQGKQLERGRSTKGQNRPNKMGKIELKL